MNDFDYDVMQKKRIASGAVHRKRGSKSKKCTLPSDYLTKKELKAMNGEVKSYNIHERMDWKKFKTLPEDVAIAHVNWLIETFGCNAEAIGRSLGVSKGCVFVWAKSQGIKFDYRRFMPSKEWLTFLGEMPVVEPEVVEETVEETKKEEDSEALEQMCAQISAELAEVKVFRGNLVLTGGQKHAMLMKLAEMLPDNVTSLDVTFFTNG